MERFQEYRGINYQIDKPDKDNEELTDGKGYYLINKFLNFEELRKLNKDLISIEEEQLNLIKIDQNSSEYGQVRSPFLSSELVRNILTSEKILALVKKHIVGNGICHLLNGQIVRSSNIHNQSLWHRDFNKTHISKPIMSFNTLFMLGEYSDINNFNTLQDKHRFSIIPFSQKLYGKPDENLLKKEEIITCEPGSLLVFNSQLWHKVLVSGLDQMFLNIMFTEPFIKQQINLLGASEDWINKYSSTESELARLLGWWSRSPKDLKEFRSPPLDIRTYRSGQG